MTALCIALTVLPTAWHPQAHAKKHYPTSPVTFTQEKKLDYSPPAVVKPAQKPVPIPVVPPEETLCTLSVVQGDLAKILQVLSAQANVNLVLLSSPSNKLTIQLSKVKFVDMLRHVCAVSGLSYLKAGSAYVVATDLQLKASYRKEWDLANPEAEVKKPNPIVTRIINLNYVSSSQVAASLTKLYPPEMLAVVAGPVQASPNVSSQSTGASTGKDSTILTKDQATAELSGKTLVLRGEEQYVDEALGVVREMDVARPQVTIEVTIHDISDSALKELGLSWSFGDVKITESGNKGVNFGTFSRSPQAFNATIKALETADKAKLLASPNISVLDGEHAFILIGDRINFPVLVGYTQANSPIFEKQEERVGIYLQVAASVSADDQVTLSLYPQVSTVTGFLNVNGASFPQISTREAQTTLRVKTGEIVVMGGLLRNEDLSQVEKVPILSDLPFIGELFKRRKRTKSASQVVISIRPTVIRPK